MSVRPAEAGDLDDLAAILGELGSALDLAARRARLAEELARPHARVLAARDEAGRVVGALVAWHVADEASVLDVAVLPGARRRGHGRALVAALAERAFAEGAALVHLEVRASNEPARALYRALGFSDARVRRGYYEDGEDAVEMHLARAGAAPEDFG